MVNERQCRPVSLMDHGLSPYHLTIIHTLHTAVAREKLPPMPAMSGRDKASCPGPSDARPDAR